MGNSYTAGMPDLVSDIASSFGDSLIWSDGSGGQAIKDHANSQHSLMAISQDAWDYVVVQCQSQEAAFRPSYLATNVFPYAQILADTIRRANSCGNTIFYMTWGRKNGDASNCQYYSPLCTYSGMTAELRKNYLKMGQDNDAFVSPVGMSWKYVRNKWSNIELYDVDESHPSPKGMYLTACTFYAVIFGKSPVGSTYKANISGPDPDSLQVAANNVVFDSLSTWMINYDTVHSIFSHTIQYDTVSFTNLNPTADSVYWEFGDGSNSRDPNPVHIYNKADSFNVDFLSFKGCNTDDTSMRIITTLKDTSSVKDTSTQILEYSIEHNNFNLFPNPIAKNQTLNLSINMDDYSNLSIQMSSIEGKTILSKSIQGSRSYIDITDLGAGIYFTTLSKDGVILSTIKLVVLE